MGSNFSWPNWWSMESTLLIITSGNHSTDLSAAHIIFIIITITFSILQHRKRPDTPILDHSKQFPVTLHCHLVSCRDASHRRVVVDVFAIIMAVTEGEVLLCCQNVSLGEMKMEWQNESVFLVCPIFNESDIFYLHATSDWHHVTWKEEGWIIFRSLII